MADLKNAIERGLITEEDAIIIGNNIGGTPNYWLQGYAGESSCASNVSLPNKSIEMMAKSNLLETLRKQVTIKL